MSLFTCPVCKEQLNISEKAYACKNGHSFDMARQGYVNLLPVNRRHSHNPGDSKEMVLSRREFLEGGKYRLFSDELNKIVAGLSKDRQNLTIIDCGCGEGYYDGRLAEYLDKLKIDYTVYGFDISKEAVRFASSKYKNIHFAVASCFDMPVISNSFDIALNIFAPMTEKELHRVLKKDGYMIYAVPGKRHLMGIKELLYEDVYENEEKNTEYEGFRFIDRFTVKNTIDVQGEELVNLFKMTPYYYKSEKSASEKLRAAGTVITEIHFDFLVYEKI